MLDINTALTTPTPEGGLRQGPTRTQAVVLLLDDQ
jgi:hypothetical protein